MTFLTQRAPAKINLSLHVGPVKANGRHDLISLVAFGDEKASDLLTAEPASHFSLAVEGPYARQTGHARDNLVLQAARAINDALDGTAPPLAFRLKKYLPCASGIGGGSADAAAALRLIIQAHGGDTVAELAQAVAPTLGGDVLACLQGLPGLMEGEGEMYTPKLNVPSLPAILVNPNLPCPTGPVYAAFDQKTPNKALSVHPPLEGRLNVDQLMTLLSTSTVNDLTEAAISQVPEIETVLDLLKQLPDQKLTRMSGSGATCFALFESITQAEHAAVSLQAEKPAWWITATMLGRGI